MADSTTPPAAPAAQPAEVERLRDDAIRKLLAYGSAHAGAHQDRMRAIDSARGNAMQAIDALASASQAAQPATAPSVERPDLEDVLYQGICSWHESSGIPGEPDDVAVLARCLSADVRDAISAAPQEPATAPLPLTEDVIRQAYLKSPLSMLDAEGNFTAGARFAEKRHGIGLHPPQEKPVIRCPEKLKNGGTCPHHNLQCGWPACNEEK